MLRVSDLHLSYGAARCLRGVDLLAEPGRITCVLGRNGVGKSSLMRAIVGLERVRSGRIEWAGKDVTALAPEIPVMAEFLPGYEITSWGSVVGPAGMPAHVVERLSALSKRALETPELRRLFVENGATPWWTTPADLIAFRRAQEARFAPLIRASGARVE